MHDGDIEWVRLGNQKWNLARMSCSDLAGRGLVGWAHACLSLQNLSQTRFPPESLATLAGESGWDIIPGRIYPASEKQMNSVIDLEIASKWVMETMVQFEMRNNGGK